MALPLIGITTYGQDEVGKFPLPREYVDCVRRAGGMPVLLPPGEADTAGLLRRVDGLILAGGGDIDPHRYGGCAHETIYMTDGERDGTELDFAREAIALKVPLLAICRGAQVVNVLRGGTLFEHLPDVFDSEIKHRIPPSRFDQLASPTAHAIHVEIDSRLATLLPTTEFSAKSWHHQAVREVGSGLDVVARAPDGVIEALEMPDHPWLFAVQWHPELTAATDPVQQALFNRLLGAG